MGVKNILNSWLIYLTILKQGACLKGCQHLNLKKITLMLIIYSPRRHTNNSFDSELYLISPYYTFDLRMLSRGSWISHLPLHLKEMIKLHSALILFCSYKDYSILHPLIAFTFAKKTVHATTIKCVYPH